MLLTGTRQVSQDGPGNPRNSCLPLDKGAFVARLRRDPCGTAYMVIRRALGGAVLWIAGVLAGTARSGDLTAIPLVPATMPTQNANFGNTILLSDELIAVGAPFDGPQNEGSVYFFEPSDTNASGWTNTGKISLPDADVEGAFGVSLEMTQNSLFVGASYMDLAAMRSGAVYVYDKTTGTESGWTLKQRITPTDGRYGLAFGQSIAVADDTLFISGPYQDPSRSGRVYVYQRDSQANDDWVLQGSLEPSRLTGDLFFGEDIDIYQNTLAVTAWGERSVYIFDRNAENTTQWDLTQVIKSSGNERYFGMSVDIDQNRLAVGSGRSDRGITGMTYVFEKQDGRWQEVAKLTAPVPARADMFGADVAFDGAELYVGAAHYQSSDPAVVYRFHTEGDLSNWQLAGEMIAPNAQPYEGFGGEIEALNGMLAVGASGRGEFGAAYLYTNQSAAIPGDFNHDGVLDWADIDLWDAAVRQSVPDPSFDLNGDADIDSADRAYWVREPARDLDRGRESGQALRHGRPGRGIVGRPVRGRYRRELSLGHRRLRWRRRLLLRGPGGRAGRRWLRTGAACGPGCRTRTNA